MYPFINRLKFLLPGLSLWGATAATALASEAPALGSIEIITKDTANVVQLTTGSLDWVKWGADANPTSLVRMSAAPHVIPNFVKLGSGELERYSDSEIAWSWTGGSPVAAEVEDRTGIRSTSKGTGFSLILPADRTVRTFKLYVGGKDSTGELTASLSDDSAPPFTFQKAYDENGHTNTTYVITYQAASASQTLTVNWLMADGNGECALQAASLSIEPIIEKSTYTTLKRGDETSAEVEPVPPRNAAARSLFDGKTLSGWEGNPKIWRAEGGVIVGGSLTEMIERNEFLASTEEFRNFILHFKIKMVGKEGGVNGGMQIRSVRVPDSHEMSGYQCDYGDPTWWGSIYDESRRNKLMAQSNMVALEPVLRRNDWNDYVIRADGRRITNWINGVQAVNFMEQDESIEQSGRLGIQVHGGGKLTVEVKDITILELPD